MYIYVYMYIYECLCMHSSSSRCAARPSRRAPPTVTTSVCHIQDSDGQILAVACAIFQSLDIVWGCSILARPRNHTASYQAIFQWDIDHRCVAWYTQGWLTLWGGTTRAEDAQGTPSQSHILPSILVYEGYPQAVGSPLNITAVLPTVGLMDDSRAEY